MRFAIWILAVFILLALQAGVLLPLHIAPANVILILLVLVLLLDSPQTALTIAGAGGVMLDFLSGTGDGLFTLSFLAVTGLMYFLFEVFLNRDLNNWIVAGSVAAATWLFALILFVGNWVFNWFGLGAGLDISSFAWQYVVLSLLFNLVLTYPIWYYLSAVELVISKVDRSHA
jgi:hypothetical protein